jgi:hypothetical protein
VTAVVGAGLCGLGAEGLRLGETTVTAGRILLSDWVEVAAGAASREGD